MHTQGHAAVSNTLRQAKRSLHEQMRDARKAVHDMRTSAEGQIRTQQRALRGQLTVETQAALNGIRQEAESALGGVQSSAHSSLPGYWHSMQGLEQALRRSAAQGGPTIVQIVTNVPPDILRGLQRTTVQLGTRLDVNRQRLDNSLSQKTDDLGESLRTQLAQFAETINDLQYRILHRSLPTLTTSSRPSGRCVAVSARQPQAGRSHWHSISRSTSRTLRRVRDKAAQLAYRC